MRRAIALGLGLVVLVVSPLVYFSLPPSFDYGDAELRAAVEGTWQLEGPRPLTLTIRQAKAATHSSAERGLVKSAAACGHRTLVRSAEACMDLSEMPLEVATSAGPASGTFTVVSTEFSSGQLTLKIPGGYLSAMVDPDGSAHDVSVGDGVAPPQPARLVRTTR
jgi:hypothetical protein